MKLYGVVGAGGFGREVMPLARRQISPEHEVVFVEADDDERRVINGYRVLHMKEFLAFRGELYYNVAISNSRIRQRIVQSFPDGSALPFSISGSPHVCLDQNDIGEGAILCSFTHVTSNARIGRFFHGSIYSYVAHDCVIGDFVTFAPRVSCNGAVTIQDHAYIGAGAVIKQGTKDKPITIGRGAVVGMGAVVTRSVAPGTTAFGNPARERN